MEELLKRLQDAGLSAADAQKAMDTTLAFIKEKIPFGLGDKVEDLLSGKLDIGSLLGGGSASASSSSSSDTGGSSLDKLKDMFK